MVISAPKPIIPIKIGDVIRPKTEKIIATKEENICPLNIPIIPKINAKGDNTMENIKIPTKPVITPKIPYGKFDL